MIIKKRVYKRGVNRRVSFIFVKSCIASSLTNIYIYKIRKRHGEFPTGGTKEGRGGGGEKKKHNTKRKRQV